MVLLFQIGKDEMQQLMEAGVLVFDLAVYGQGIRWNT